MKRIFRRNQVIITTLGDHDRGSRIFKLFCKKGGGGLGCV